MSAATSDPGPTVVGGRPGLPARALHLFVLWGFAVVQPLLDVLGRGAELFVAHDGRPAEIVALTFGLCLLPPILMAGVEMAAGRIAPRVGRASHRVLMFLLAAAAILQGVKRLDSLPGALQVAAAVICGAVAAWAYGRFAGLRTYLSYLAPAPLVFAAVFLWLSPVSKLVLASRNVPAGAIDAVRAGGADDPSRPRPPVVLVVFDELSLPTLMDRTRRIDSARYPNFAALAAGSHWFRNATATAAVTAVAVPALLTGRYLAEGDGRIPVATAASYPRNLFTWLGGGYRLNVFERVTDLCPDEVCGRTRPGSRPDRRWRALLSDLKVVYLHLLLPVDLAADLPPIEQQWGHFTAGDAEAELASAGDGDLDGSAPRIGSGSKVRVMSEFQEAVRADPGGQGAGSLHFLHSGLPHVPWRYLPSGNHYGTGRDRLIRNGPGIRKGIWSGDPWPALQGFQRYLLQLSFLDLLLGDLLRTFQESGLYDRALVIVTADHGVSFQPGKSRRIVDRQNFADIMSVPLFVKLPHQRESTLSDRNVELIDVLPTIVEVLGLEAPWPMDGSSVFSVVPERLEKHVVRGPRGRKLSFDVAAMDAKYQTLERMVEVFGPSSDPLALYRIGPYPELVGRPLSELEIEPESEPGPRFKLKVPEIYDDVDPVSGFVPARVVGTLRSPELARKPLELAVAVGGTVWATTHVPREQTSRAPFTAMVPERALVAGSNRVEVFVVNGPPESPRLVPAR